MRHDPVSEDVSDEVIEQYKAAWKKHGFPDADFGLVGQHSNGVSNNIFDKSYQPLGEHWLWVAVLLEAVADYKKTSHYWDQPCIECHDNQACLHVVNGRIHRKGQWQGWDACEHNHSYHRCAHDWLLGESCADICDLLGVDVSYFRAKMEIV